MTPILFKTPVLFLLGALASPLANAGSPVWTFTPNPSFPPTATVSVNGAATVQYTVTNQSTKRHTLVMTPITGITPTWACDPSCQGAFCLPGKGSACTLTLSVDASQIKERVISGPWLCQEPPAGKIPTQCYGPSPGDLLNITISPPTITTLSTSLNPSTSGSSVTFTANVISNNGAPTGGSVDFTANGTTISGCASRPLDSGVATCTTSSLTTSTPPYAIGATYTGTPGFAGSTSTSLNQYVVVSIEQVTVPSAPIDVTVIPGNERVTVNWYPPTNTGGAIITGYTVTYGVTGSIPYNTTTTTCILTPATNCTVTSLDNGTSYTFVVTASNASGKGLAAYSSPTTPEGPATAALTASPATLAVSGFGTGAVPRTITITNNAAHDVAISNISAPNPALPGQASIVTSLSSSCVVGKNLTANGGTCTLTVNPGGTPTSSSNCTLGTAPTPSNINLSYNGGSVGVDVVVLGYGCNYQGGYVFSIDDTTPLTSSVGGKDVTVKDQPSTKWGAVTSGESVWGIADTSTIASPEPNTDFSSYIASQLNCDGLNDGACDSNNIFVYYSTPLADYAAGVCLQGGDSLGNFPCTTGTCYSDWYLPSMCELGGFSLGCTSSTSIQSQLWNVTMPLIGNFANYYWSSTQASSNPASGAYLEHFNPDGGGYSSNLGKPFPFNVRCSRALTL